MSKKKGINRYTCSETGRPVMEVTKEQLGAVLGKSSSRTATRAVSRWHAGAGNNGKGDMPRPQSPEGKARADVAWLTAYCTWYTDGNEDCDCFECHTSKRSGTKNG